MPLRRDKPPTDDIHVLWRANNSDLVDRLIEFIAEVRGTKLTADQVADQLHELLTNPGPRSHLVQLGDPPPRNEEFAALIRRARAVPEPGA